MFKLTFLYFFMIHIIGDYYFQNQMLADGKRKDINKVLLHCLIYTIAAIVISIFVWSITFLIYVVIFSLLHLIIDVIKFIVIKSKSKENNKNKIEIRECVTRNNRKVIAKKKAELGSNFDSYIYVFDQALHIVSIFFLSYIFYKSGHTIKAIDLFYEVNIPMEKVLSMIIIMLLIIKPVNVTFRIMFLHVKPENEVKNNKSEYNTGKLIGSIERLLIAILLLLNQYTAIGFVFTAKSITRFDKISTDQSFAEYYLLGTLFSMLSTIIIVLLFYKI